MEVHPISHCLRQLLTASVGALSVGALAAFYCTMTTLSNRLRQHSLSASPNASQEGSPVQHVDGMPALKNYTLTIPKFESRAATVV